jgi:hypothetical protein
MEGGEPMQAPLKKPTPKQYSGRGTGKVVRTITYEREADDLVRFYAPGGRDHGRFIARCVFEHHARRVWEAELLTRTAWPWPDGGGQP